MENDDPIDVNGLGVNELAVLVSSNPNTVAGRAALVLLRPIHVRLAEQVMQRAGLRDQDIRDQLVFHLEQQLREGKYDRSRGNYIPWAKTVLTHKLTSILRSSEYRTRVDHDVTTEMRSHDDTIRDWQSQQDLECPFSAKDLATLEEWNNFGRIVLLCRLNIWKKAAPEPWNRWLLKCDITAPFPEEHFEDLESKVQLDQLAEVLHISRSYVNTLYSRGMPMISRLEFIQGLQP